MSLLFILLSNNKTCAPNLRVGASKLCLTLLHHILNFNLPSPLSLRVYLTLLSCSVKGRGSQQDQPGLLVTDESGKEAAPGFSPPHPDTGQQAARDDSAAAPWRRPASLRARPSQR